MSARAGLALAGAMLLAALACWWADGPPVLAGTSPAAPAAADPARRGAVDAGEPAAAASRSLVSTGETSPRARSVEVRLTVRLEDTDGRPVAGTVYATTGREALDLPLLGDPAPWQRPLPSTGGRGDFHDAPSGSVVFGVPAGQPIWIRAAATARPAAPVYERLQGLDGDRELRLCLDARAQRRIHVRVHRADLDGPQPGAEVELHGPDAAAAAWRGRTDADGYALAPAPAAGVVAVQVAGAAAADADARAVLRMDTVPGDAVVELAAPEPRAACDFVVESDLLPRPGAPPPAVILRRVDGGRACVRLLAPALPPGRSEHALELPFGSFAVVPLPQGCARVEGGGAEIVEVAAAGARSWHLRLGAVPARDLELAGIPPTEMPVQVRVLAPDDLLDTADDRIWLGPPRWHRRRERVHAWPVPARLLALGRGGAWVSGILAPQGPETVAMLPACAVEVLAPVERGRDGGLVAELSSAAEVCARALRAEMVATQQGRRPRLRALLFAPAGRVTVVVRDARGAELWRQDAQASGCLRVLVP